MGREGQYDLKLADSTNAITPNESEKEDIGKPEISTFVGSDHPTKLLKSSCIKLLQVLAVSVGLHADKMQQNAVQNMASMFRDIISSRINFTHLGLDRETICGFLRAISTCREFSNYLTSDAWIKLYFDVLESNENSENILGKIQCLRLLQNVLLTWDALSSDRMIMFVERIMNLLSNLCIYCPNDYSLLQNPQDVKSRVLMTASHTSTIAEEMIVLLKRLYLNQSWRNVITEFVSQKLYIAADLFSQGINDPSNIKSAVKIVGSLNFIGGYDSRPRIGLNVYLEEESRATISGFSKKGNAIVYVHNSNEIKKLNLLSLRETIEEIPFKMTKLPMNEILLNSFALLIYGPGERKIVLSNDVDVCLLRSQQIQLASLSSIKTILRNQMILRKILKQRSPGLSNLSSYSSSESISDAGIDIVIEKKKTKEVKEEMDEEGETSPNATSPEDAAALEAATRDPATVSLFNRRDCYNGESLFQYVLFRSIQPSPLKACYSYNDMELAALNVSQVISSNLSLSSDQSNQNYTIKKLPPPMLQPTMVHGVPIYNINSMADWFTGDALPGTEKKKSEMVSYIVEMGFTLKRVEKAIAELSKLTLEHYFSSNKNMCKGSFSNFIIYWAITS